MSARRCQDCGGGMAGRGNRASRCEPCQAAHRRTLTARRVAKHRHGREPIALHPQPESREGLIFEVQRSTSSGPRGRSALTIQAADAFAAVQEVARRYGDSGQGRIMRASGRRGVRTYALTLRRGVTVRYDVTPAPGSIQGGG